MIAPALSRTLSDCISAQPNDVADHLGIFFSQFVWKSNSKPFPALECNLQRGADSLRVLNHAVPTAMQLSQRDTPRIRVRFDVVKTKTAFDVAPNLWRLYQ